MSLPNWEPGEASRDSAYVLAGSRTRVRHRQGARMVGRANSPGRMPLTYGCVVAPGVGREIAAETGIKRKQEEGLLAGPEAGGWPTAATGGSQQSALSGSHFKPPPLVEVLTFEAMLYRRWRQTLRSRPAGGGFKPPQAAVVKSHGGER